MPFPQREPGGRGRIRTFVARKERQIYSLLVLATHPPVPRKLLGRVLRVPFLSFNHLQAARAKTQKGLVSRDTSPFILFFRIRSASLPLQISWWSWRRELNPRPSDYKSDALPAELRQRRSNQARIADGATELQVAPPISSTPSASSVEKPSRLWLTYQSLTSFFSIV